MRFFTFSLVTLMAAATAVTLYEEPAHACGGCFVPPSEETAVNSHRMVISLGLEQTILWDQIIYSGEPADFVWVLPVPTPDVAIEVTDGEFFDDLDRQTAPTIQAVSPPPSCPTAQSAGSGCAAEDAQLYPGGGGPSDGVTVYDHGVVGPYETLTIGAEDPNGLYTWLTDNGYNVAQEAVPAMEYYIGLEHAFVVLRLQPDVGVDAMQPVRIRYPGFMGTFPLKMVVVGAQGVLDLALWIVAEQRYEAMNYGTLRIDENDLAWDWDTNTSNYNQVFDDLVAGPEGLSRAWVAEFADALDNLYLQDDENLDLIRFDIPAPYVTRLRTRMLVDNINEDMILAPAEDPGSISNFLFAYQNINYPELNCNNAAGGDNSVYCRLGNGSGKDAAFLGLVMIFGLFIVFRLPRRRRRTRATRAD